MLRSQLPACILTQCSTPNSEPFISWLFRVVYVCLLDRALHDSTKTCDTQQRVYFCDTKILFGVARKLKSFTFLAKPSNSCKNRPSVYTAQRSAPYSCFCRIVSTRLLSIRAWRVGRRERGLHSRLVRFLRGAFITDNALHFFKWGGGEGGGGLLGELHP